MTEAEAIVLAVQACLRREEPVHPTLAKRIDQEVKEITRREQNRWEGIHEQFRKT